MLFERRLREGIRAGTVSLAYRRWQRPQVVAGGRYRTGLDLVELTALDVVEQSAITADDARRAGFDDVESLVADLRGDPGLPLYRLEFRLLDEPDPRTVLAADDSLDEVAVAELDRRLERLDTAAGAGWTLALLEAIAGAPGRRAAELAHDLDREKEPLKADVRKLKTLGLTISLGTGYRLSPRGEAYLRLTRRGRG